MRNLKKYVSSYSNLRSPSGASLVLVSVDMAESRLSVNTEKIVLGSMLLKEIKSSLERS